MTKRDISLIKQRVLTRLEELDMTVAEATRRGGLPKDFIYDLLNERKKSVRLDNISKLAIALDCDIQYLEGTQEISTVIDDMRHLGMPSIDIVGEVEAGVFVDRKYLQARTTSVFDFTNLPPDTRFAPEGQVDLFVKGNSIDKFAPSGYILRCILIEHWPSYVRDGDLVIVERYKSDLVEKAAWRVKINPDGLEFSSDTNDRKQQSSWRMDLDQTKQTEFELDPNSKLKSHMVHDLAQAATDVARVYAIVIFAYAEPRLRRMF